MSVSLEELQRLRSVSHPNPHAILGQHPTEGGGVRLLVLRPGASAVVAGGVTLEQIAPDLFEGSLVGPVDRPALLTATDADGSHREFLDPYAFLPTLGDIDLHLIGEGRHWELGSALGAQHRSLAGVEGIGFSVWAPNAQAVSLVGDHNGWDLSAHPMRTLGASGIWELFIPGLPAGASYKYVIRTADGGLVEHTDPVANQVEAPPATASLVAQVPAHRWKDETWQDATHTPHAEPVSIFEVHLASWRRHPDGRSLSYRELAEVLPQRVRELGFTHVELMPVMAYPFSGSWGYQCTGYFAPAADLGSPDDLRALIDALHRADIGVILDWVPAHFPKDDWALARFDGSHLYEHVDPQRGEHPDWGTLVFNHGRTEVRNFLIASACHWIERYHADGLRVDAVASMLYRDYSRTAGQWSPNEHGGREDLEAIAFLKELNRVVYARNPNALMCAEESTAFPGVSRPVDHGGLGFGFKWNMGWMHDTLDYIGRDPIHRMHHHSQLTFGLLYAFSENFILPLSHDEVVHGKGSLIQRMPGDRWQQFANLRALYGHMWAHPGKKLIFMGCEFAQWREWNHDGELDWSLREDADHAGVERLICDLNRRYRELPALWRRDDDPAAFAWLEPDDPTSNVVAYARRGEAGDRAVVCVANFSPVPRSGYRIGLPRGGRWEEVLNTDAVEYGGTGVGNLGGVEAEPFPWRGKTWSTTVTIPPLGVVWLASPE